MVSFSNFGITHGLSSDRILWSISVIFLLVPDCFLLTFERISISSRHFRSTVYVYNYLKFYIFQISARNFSLIWFCFVVQHSFWFVTKQNKMLVYFGCISRLWKFGINVNEIQMEYIIERSNYATRLWLFQKLHFNFCEMFSDFNIRNSRFSTSLSFQYQQEFNISIQFHSRFEAKISSAQRVLRNFFFVSRF